MLWTDWDEIFMVSSYWAYDNEVQFWAPNSP